MPIPTVHGNGAAMRMEMVLSAISFRRDIIIGDDSKEEIGNLAKRYKQDAVRSDTGLHFHLQLGDLSK